MSEDITSDITSAVVGFARYWRARNPDELQLALHLAENSPENTGLLILSLWAQREWLRAQALRRHNLELDEWLADIQAGLLALSGRPQPPLMGDRLELTGLIQSHWVICRVLDAVCSETEALQDEPARLPEAVARAYARTLSKARLLASAAPYESAGPEGDPVWLLRFAGAAQAQLKLHGEAGSRRDAGARLRRALEADAPEGLHRALAERIPMAVLTAWPDFLKALRAHGPQGAGSLRYRVSKAIEVEAGRGGRSRSVETVPLDRIASLSDGGREIELFLLKEEVRAQLSAGEWRVAELTFFEGLTIQEAAARLGKAEGTVKSFQDRARRKLKAGRKAA